MVLKIIELTPKILPPQSIGIYPPKPPPIVAPIQMSDLVLIGRYSTIGYDDVMAKRASVQAHGSRSKKTAKRRAAKYARLKAVRITRKHARSHRHR